MSMISGQRSQATMSTLLLFGAYLFAFLLGEAVHELGHYLADTAWGLQVKVLLDPFGGSRIQPLAPLPDEPLGFPDMAGPLLNLTGSALITALRWHRPRPLLLPLLMWRPVAWIQEGINLSAGLLSPGSDVVRLAAWGIPQPLLLILGLLFLLAGLVALCCLFPLLGIAPRDPFWRKFGIIAGGMVTLLLIRAVHAAVVGSEAGSQMAPLAAGLLLAALLAWGHRYIAPALGRVSPAAYTAARWPRTAIALALGIVMFAGQWFWFN